MILERTRLIAPKIDDVGPFFDRVAASLNRLGVQASQSPNTDEECQHPVYRSQLEYGSVLPVAPLY
jgi:hypothetical protein